MLAFLPSGFRALADEGQLSLDLVKVLLRVSLWINVVNDGDKLKDIGMLTELRPWVDIENTVTCIQAEAERSASLPSTEAIASLSLFCLCCYILRRFSSSGVFYYMLAELMESVELYTPQTEAQTHLQVWAATLASGIANEGTPLGSGRLVNFVIERVPNLIRVADLQLILRRFLLFNKSLTAWTLSWSRALERRR